MLREGEIDAAIYGVNLRTIRPLGASSPIPKPPLKDGSPGTGSCRSTTWWWSPKKLAQTRPDLVREVYRLLLESKRAAGMPRPGTIDILPFGLRLAGRRWSC